MTLEFSQSIAEDRYEAKRNLSATAIRPQRDYFLSEDDVEAVAGAAGIDGAAAGVLSLLDVFDSEPLLDFVSPDFVSLVDLSLLLSLEDFGLALP